jgi:hypothetical protein
MGDAAPDIYAVLRLRGHAGLEEIAVAMGRLAASHERFRVRAVCCGGTWSIEVCGRQSRLMNARERRFMQARGRCVVHPPLATLHATLQSTHRCSPHYVQCLACPPRSLTLRCCPSHDAWQLLEDFDARQCMREVELEGADIDAAFNSFVSRVRRA